MSYETIDGGLVPIKAWTVGVPVEDLAREQLRQAGRVMSRGAAKKAITLEQHAADTAGTICRQDADVLDESPRAYKDLSAVMSAQSELVDVVHELRSVVCVKG
jgi:RNA-splicing ligase RtcB